MKKFIRTGNLSKATTAEDGSLHLLVLASGPELDKSGERVSKAALDQLAETAKAGTIRLTPSHDVPITLGKSVDAWADEAGHTFIDFLLSAENPLASQLHAEVASGDWADRQVSIGGKATKALVYDSEAKKSITELTALKVNHVALTFPEHGIYHLAALTEAVVKAFKAKDTEALKAAGVTEEEITKAYDSNGNWVPQTFAGRWAAEKLADELPEMLDCLRWNIECILWVDDTATKRALLAQTFTEFIAAVLGEVSEAVKSFQYPASMVALEARVSELAKGMADVKALVEKVEKATQPSIVSVMTTQPDLPSVTTATATPAEPVIVNKSIPDTTPETAAAITNPDPPGETAKKARKAELAKSMEAAKDDPVKRSALQQELNALNAQ